MERRLKLGPKIENLTASGITPKVKFANSGKELTITFSIKSFGVPDAPIPPNQDPQRDTHRDLIELVGGNLYGTNLSVALFAIDKNASTMVISMNLNSKIPGTGAAFTKKIKK